MTVKCWAENGVPCHLPECQRGDYCWEAESLRYLSPLQVDTFNEGLEAAAKLCDEAERNANHGFGHMAEQIRKLKR